MSTTYGNKQCNLCTESFWTRYPEQNTCPACIIKMSETEAKNVIEKYLGGEQDWWKSNNKEK